MIVTGQQIFEALDRAGARVGDHRFKDARYVVPTIRYITGEFARDFRTLLRQVSEYVLERWDCDNYSLLAKAHMKICHALSHQGPEDIAFATWDYKPDGSENYHELLATVARGPAGALTPVWFEPQPNQRDQCMQRVRMSLVEIESCVASDW